MRVYELAKQVNLTSKELLEVVRGLGFEVKSHSSALSPEQVAAVRSKLKAPPGEGSPSPETARGKVVAVKLPLTVLQLAQCLEQKPNVLIKSLLQKGIFASLNQFLDEATAVALARECGCTLLPEVARVVPEVSPDAAAAAVVPSPPVKAPEARRRAPVVTLMGHIDHGKTSLLDAIRLSRITAGEAGGITQHIGAYQVSTRHGPIVILDTPGHEAFTTMRARGARITDLVVLVVAADEGIMPQTLEAIDHARAAGVPILVAINKMDKTAAAPDRVRRQLAERELVPEAMGGEIVCCEVSALSKQGLDALLEMISLQAEMMELKAVDTGPARGAVIEAKLTAERGPVVSLLVQAGCLRRGDYLVCDAYPGKVKALFDDRGQAVSAAGPSTPVEVLGIQGVPKAGAVFEVVAGESAARRICAEMKSAKPAAVEPAGPQLSLEDFLDKLSQEDKKELRLILKADVQGSLEAVSQALQKLSTAETGLNIIHSGVGAVTESDIMLAAASRTVVIVFNLPVASRIQSQARKEGVDIRRYDIIYQAVDDVEKALKGMLEPKVVEVTLGRALVKETFKITRQGVIAGCLVEEGKIRAASLVKVLRGAETVARDKVVSLRRFKDGVREVSAGQECGIALANFHGFAEGDVIEAFETKTE